MRLALPSLMSCKVLPAQSHWLITAIYGQRTDVSSHGTSFQTPDMVHGITILKVQFYYFLMSVSSAVVLPPLTHPPRDFASPFLMTIFHSLFWPKSVPSPLCLTFILRRSPSSLGISSLPIVPLPCDFYGLQLVLIIAQSMVPPL